jgi:hypothetical protein
MDGESQRWCCISGDADFAAESVLLFPIAQYALASPDTVAGIPSTKALTVQLVLECCHAGWLMRAAGLVHRDIRPKTSCSFRVILSLLTLAFPSLWIPTITMMACALFSQEKSRVI